LLLFALTSTGILAAQNSTTIKATPLAVVNGTAQSAGPYNPQQMLRLVFALKPPHLEEEEEFLRQLQDPASPKFHQYLSQQQWNERFAPSAQDEQAVVSWAQSQGMTITSRFANRLLVDVEAPISVIQRAFNVTINAYQLEGKSYFSNDRDPSLPASLAPAINAVFGLNNMEVVHSFSRHKDNLEYPVYSPGPGNSVDPPFRKDGDAAKFAAQMASKGKSQRTSSGRGYGMFGAYDPSDIYSSYAYNYQPLMSLGHCCNPLNNPNNSPPEASAAISISGDYNDSDIDTFASNFGLAVNVQRHHVNGTAPCCSTEATMDAEWITATANSFGNPSNTAQVHVYVSSTWDLGNMLAGVNQAGQDGLARVLSMSWGAAEDDFGSGYMNSFHYAFNQLIGQGWTIVVAGGDAGSTTDCRTVSVSYPASDPDVTAVGGTNLETSQNGYSYENVWTGGTYDCVNNDGGGGGGCSNFFTAPGYQVMPACSNGRRSVPDLALNADWVNSPQNIYYDGSWYQDGGTSVAAPEMSGFIAQENAYLLYVQSLVGNTCGPYNSAACSPVGTVNTFIYSEGDWRLAPHYPFYDITQGCNNNDITQKYGLQYFCAAPGYDLASGWGSANMFQFAWMINYALAGDGQGPSISISGPPVNHWYNTDQTISWSMTDVSGNGHQPIGVAGSSQAWDADPGDSGSEPFPGAGSNFYGLQSYGASGAANGLANLSQGCHTGYVRGWDNAGNASLAGYGPLCFDNIPPVTQIVLSGNQQQFGHYTGPVQVSLVATDNASGVAVTYYAIDYGNYLTYSNPFYSYLPGYHCVEAYSVDNAGNQESPVEQCFNIDSNTQFTLSVTKTGTGGGTVTSSDGAIQCGSTCSALYYDEQPVTLTASPQAGSLFTGWRNCDLSFGFSCTLTITAARTVTAVFNLPVALQYVPLSPCRVVDTRLPNGPFGGPAISGGTSRDFALPAGPCPNIPANAAAYSLNVTAVPHGYLAYLSAWPTGFTRPLTSVMNSFDGRIKANAVILPAGDTASVSVFVSNTADVVLDIDGYFISPSASTVAFFSLPPCRVIDTRNANGPLGGPILQKNQSREFPILDATGCGIPPTGAAAYSFNVTAVPQDGQELSYLTVWPSGVQQPVASTLNALTGTITANAAIVPAGTGGEISVYPAGNNTDLVVDINGYFAAPSSGQNPLSLYTFNPCRVLDTRQNGGAFDGQIVVGVENSACEVPAAAQAYNLNATVLPNGALGYLTLWADGQPRPLASTLNALDGAVTSNMAIVPTNNGSIDAYAAGLTQLILDISSYFAP
jgi:hypothetical protein